MFAYEGKMMAEPKDILERVRDLREDGQPERALQVLAEGSRTFPNAVALGVTRAALLRSLGKWQEQQACLADLQIRFPRNPGVLLETVRQSSGRGAFGDARGVLDQVLKDHPQHQGALAILLDLEVGEDNFHLALQAQNMIIETHGTGEALERRRGVLLRSLRRLRESHDVLSRLHQAFPASVPTLQQLIHTLQLVDVQATQSHLETLAALDPGSVQTAILEIGFYLATGETERAKTIVEKALLDWPGNDALLQRAAQVQLARAQPAAALEILAPLSGEGSNGLPLLMARARALLALEELDEASCIYWTVLDLQGPHVGAISGLLRAASMHSWPVDTLRDTARKLHDLVDNWAAHGHGNLVRFRAEIARCMGHWEALEAASCDWMQAQPTDARAGLYLATARFGTGQTAEADRLLVAYRAHGNQEPAALLLGDRISLALGRVAQNLSERMSFLRQPGHRELSRDLQTVQDLFFLGRIGEAHDALDRCMTRQGSIPNKGLALELRFQGRTTEAARVAGETWTPRLPEHTETPSAEYLEVLFDFERGLGSTPALPFSEATLAWSLCKEPTGSFPEWYARACQATFAYGLLSRMRPRLEDLLCWVDPIDLGHLGECFQHQRPALIATSHNGPMTYVALSQHHPDIHYLANIAGDPVAPLYTGKPIFFEGDHLHVAALIVKALQKGHSVMLTPDGPASYLARATPSSAATGDIFGVPCALPNTVPKLAQELRVPVFFLQTKWRLGRIFLDITRMADPEPGEPSQAWYDRWAQEYLDGVAAVMQSGPENQNLYAPLWRHLLLNGATSLATARVAP